MSDSIAKHFDQFFEIVFANTPELIKEGQRIRHQVYSDELGWEPKYPDGLEKDEYDQSAYTLLLRHKQSGVYAGTVRIIVPPCDRDDFELPFQAHCFESIKQENREGLCLSSGFYGEVSRLAVPEQFRRRKGEKNKPFVLNFKREDGKMLSRELTADELRAFPNIAISLYLAIIAMAKLFNHKMMYVVVEPRLARSMKFAGIHFQQIGEDMDYHGKRAVFCLPRNDFDAKYESEIKELYDLLENKLVQQLALKPYREPHDTIRV